MNRSSTFKAPRTGGVRFAPSPTGLFHVGNLRTAWISHEWARAKALDTKWVVRFEDIDTARVLPQAREHQLNDFSAFGWKPDVLLTQSEFYSRHNELFQKAKLEGMAYPCDCSRKDVKTALSQMASAANDGSAPVYSGHCREQNPERELKAQASIAWRFRMPDSSGNDDFIIARSDVNGGSLAFAYHWACAIDDYDGDYRLIVRSIDLSPALRLQRAVQDWMGSIEGEPRSPAVFHTSLVVQNDGHRLEKRTQGMTLNELLEKKLSIADIRKYFELSFDFRVFETPPMKSGVMNETQATIKLSDFIR